MMDTPTRRLVWLVFRMMAYRTPSIPPPPPGTSLSGVTVVNPGQTRHANQMMTIEAGVITRIVPCTWLATAPATPSR